MGDYSWGREAVYSDYDLVASYTCPGCAGSDSCDYVCFVAETGGGEWPRSVRGRSAWVALHVFLKRVSLDACNVLAWRYLHLQRACVWSAWVDQRRSEFGRKASGGRGPVSER